MALTRYEIDMTTVGWAKKHGARVAFGTDLLFQPEGTRKQNELLIRLFDKEAKLGVLKEGVWADMLLVDGEPERDIGVLQDYEKKFVVIIKDREIHKKHAFFLIALFKPSRNERVRALFAKTRGGMLGNA